MSQLVFGTNTRLAAAAFIVVGCAPPPDLGGDAGVFMDSAADGGDEGGASGLDEARLDRSAEGSCGYPGAGANGYGSNVGQRLPNSDAFTLELCDGTEIELGDFLCKREDEFGDFNRGVLVNLGAGWCGPCQDETLEFPELYEEYNAKGIEIVQVLFQDWTAQQPTKTFCEDWSTGQWKGEGGHTDAVDVDIQYPVAIDQVFDWASQYLADPMSAAPVNILIDANGNIRWKLEGQKPELDVLRAQFDLVIANPYGD